MQDKTRFLLGDDGVPLIWTKVLAERADMREISRAEMEARVKKIKSDKENQVEQNLLCDKEVQAIEAETAAKIAALQADAESQIDQITPSVEVSDHEPVVHPKDPFSQYQNMTKAQLTKAALDDFGYEFKMPMNKQEMLGQLFELLKQTTVSSEVQ